MESLNYKIGKGPLAITELHLLFQNIVRTQVFIKMFVCYRSSAAEETEVLENSESMVDVKRDADEVKNCCCIELRLVFILIHR